MLRIKARHIQVDSLQRFDEVMRQWKNGEDFAVLAGNYSQCPTARQGGLLSGFGPGHLPPELDRVVCEGDVGGVYGPIQSSRGIHLVEILEKSE